MTHAFRLYYRDAEVSELMAEKLSRAGGDDVTLHVSDGQACADWEIEADSMLDAVKAAIGASAAAGFHVARALPLPAVDDIDSVTPLEMRRRRPIRLRDPDEE